MLRTRVMPCLLLDGEALVKTVRFRRPSYVGDPVNTVRIFNEKEVDEIIILDIRATREQARPSFDLIAEIAGECFMPVTYGGGVRDVEDMKRIFQCGVEKIALNAYAVENPAFIRRASDVFGSQSIVVSMDVKKNLFGQYRVVTHGGRNRTGLDPVAHARAMAGQGAGEILLNSVDRDGTFQGFDLELIQSVVRAVDMPVIACGGAGCLEDLGRAAREGGASGVAAGSLVVYQGPNRSVLINFPQPADLESILGAERETRPASPLDGLFRLPRPAAVSATKTPARMERTV